MLGLLVIGTLGIGTDLLLLGHYEDAWQVLPLILIGLALAAIVWHAIRGSAASVRALQIVMTLCAISGMIGVVLHYRASMEFQLESGAVSGGWPLFWKTIHAKAPPALAPGAMTQLGLLGLLYTFRHAALTRLLSISPGNPPTRQTSTSS